jgi:hypothetical protein
MMRFLVVAGIGAVLLAGCAASDFDGDAYRATIHQSFAAQPNVHVGVDNVSGDVTVLPWSRPNIDIVAVKHAGSKESLNRVTVEIDRDQIPTADVEIHTHYAHTWFGGNTGDVDYTLHVPRGASLTVRTVSGDVRASGLGRNVEIRTVSGDVTAMRTGGSLTAHSISGDIRTSMLRMGKGDTADIDTVSGDIHLGLPSAASASVEIKSLSGDLVDDWNIPTAHQAVGVSATGRIGGGAGNINLHSISGDIHLSRSE